MPQDYDWSEFIPPGRAVELSGKWKHGYIPLDAAALSEKMHGRTGGAKWWNKSEGGGKHARKMLTTKEIPSAGAKKRPNVGPPKPGKTTFLKASQAPGAKAGTRQDLYHVTRGQNIDRINKEGFHGKSRYDTSGGADYGGSVFGDGTYFHGNKADSDKWLAGAHMFEHG